jgi:hypothetical protein
MTKTYAITRASSVTFIRPTNNKQLPELTSTAWSLLVRKGRVNTNYLRGPIPKSFQCLLGIENLNLVKHQLYGSVPDAISKLPKLGLLNLSDNYFSKICPECSKLIAKKVVDPKGNCIHGLPNQRSKAECDAFLSKPKSCPI